MQINLPERVSFILECLNLSGYAAYVVGGCVRDSVLGIAPHDWDICTSARPEETMEIFKQIGWGVVETGVKYGTVTVIAKNSYEPDEPFEITTFRIDGEYKDNRRPDDVTFTDDLMADLSRRDFTINAMAYHPQFGLIDPFGGEEDIKHKMIRCVGDPEKRFGEDALRMLRAVRFALRYDYDIETETLMAIHNMEKDIQNISKERIASEITRILNETFFPGKSYDSAMFQFKSFLSYICPIENIDIIMALSFCDNDLEASLAVLYDNDNIERNLLEFRFPKVVAEQAAEIRRIGKHILNSGSLNENGRKFRFFCRRMISDVKLEHCIFYVAKCAVHYAMAKCKTAQRFPALSRLEKQIDRVADETIPVRTCNLAIDGNDVMLFGYNGKEVGFVLRNILDKVMHEDLNNDKDSLMRYIEKEKRHIDFYLSEFGAGFNLI